MNTEEGTSYSLPAALMTAALRQAIKSVRTISKTKKDVRNSLLLLKFLGSNGKLILTESVDGLFDRLGFLLEHGTESFFVD